MNFSTTDFLHAIKSEKKYFGYLGIQPHYNFVAYTFAVLGKECLSIHSGNEKEPRITEKGENRPLTTDELDAYNQALVLENAEP